MREAFCPGYFLGLSKNVKDLPDSGTDNY